MCKKTFKSKVEKKNKNNKVHKYTIIIFYKESDETSYLPTLGNSKLERV